MRGRNTSSISDQISDKLEPVDEANIVKVIELLQNFPRLLFLRLEEDWMTCDVWDNVCTFAHSTSNTRAYIYLTGASNGGLTQLLEAGL